MKNTLLLSVILALVFLAPEETLAQSLPGQVSANPFGVPSPGLANGGVHFHVNPSDDHYAFESLDRHTLQYEALHGYEHYRGKALQQIDRFPDIQYPKQQPYNPPSSDSFFGVESYNPLNW